MSKAKKQEFDDMDGYLPHYEPPKPTGDELFDMMMELAAYREWQATILRMRGDVQAIMVHTMSREISKEIDKAIIKDLLSMGNKN